MADYEFTLDDIARLDETINPKPHSLSPFIGGRDDLASSVGPLATAVASVAGDLLDGDIARFERLHQRRVAEAQQYTTDAQVHQLRSLIDAAWQQRNYREVVVLLRQLPELTAVEQQKLQFASKNSML